MSRLIATWRVARRLALSRSQGQRWRQISVVCGSALAALALLIGLSVVSWATRVDDHVATRAPAMADGQRPVVLLVDNTMPIIPGGFSQIPIVWLEPLGGHEHDASVIPPGLSKLPSPGEAVLSPGLVRHGYRAEDFGFRSSDAGTGEHGVIGDEGLASRSEGFMYVRPVAGRSIASDAALRTAGYLNGSVARVNYLEAVLDVPGRAQALIGVSWLLWLPALHLLAGSARTVSSVRQARASILWRLGVSTFTVRRLVALETAVLSALGAAGGASAFLLTMQHRVTFPLTDAVLLPNAGALRWSAFLLVMLGVPALAALAAAFEPIPGTRREEAPRAKQLQPLRIIPLMISLGAMYVSPLLVYLLPRDAGSDIILIVLFLGAIATVATLPLAMPVITSWVAHAVGAMRHPAWWLAGHKLALSKRELSRPAALVGCLVFIAGAAVALLQGVQENRSMVWIDGGNRNVWSVKWVDSTPNDVKVIADRARDEHVQVARVAYPKEPAQSDTSPPPSALPQASFATCPRAAEFFDVPVGVLECNAKDVTELAVLLPYHVTTAPLTAPASNELLVSAPREWSDVDLLRLFRGMAVVNTTPLTGSSEAFLHPGRDWLATAWASATVLLLLGLLRSMADRTVQAVSERALLERVGLRPEEAEHTYAIATLVPIAVTLPLGFLAALLFALRGWGMGITAFNLGLIGLVTVAMAVASIMVVLATLTWQRHVDRTRR